MGDKPSGGTQQTFSNQNSNSTNTAGPNPQIAGMLQNITGNAWDWTNQNMNAPGYFPGGTVAQRSPGELSARDANWTWATQGLNSLQGNYQPTIDYLTGQVKGQGLDIANQPYWQDALAASFRPQAEQFRDIIAPGIDSTFAGAGRTGGGAHFDTSMRGVQDLERSQSDSAAKAVAGLYDSALNRQSGAATALPGVYGQMQGQAGNWLGMLNQVGAGDTAAAQQQLDAQNAKYGYDTTAQLDWYNRLAQSFQGMYPGGQTTGQQSGSSQGYGGGSPGGGGAGSFLGPAMGIAGLALQAAPLFGASDRRLKTDIEELGIDPLTGLKQYAYRYKSDPKSYPKTVGPMAQDIEEVRPDLVHEIAGRKVVPMAALAPGGGGLF